MAIWVLGVSLRSVTQFDTNLHRLVASHKVHGYTIVLLRFLSLTVIDAACFYSVNIVPSTLNSFTTVCFNFAEQ